MLSWLHERTKERSKERVIATRMRLVAPQAVPDWLCEFATLLESGVRPERVSEKERSDAKRAEENEVTTFVELYPYRDTPWACFLTLRYLTCRPHVEGRDLDITDIVAATPALRRDAPCYERVIARNRPRPVTAAVRDAVARWLDGAEEAVRRAAGIRDRRLAFHYAVGQKYRVHQAALHESREGSATPAEAVEPAAVRTAAEFHLDGNEPGDADQALAILRRSAIEGDVRARYELGMAYLAADNAGRNHREGVMWLERAAAGGCVPARFEIGRVYAEGKHVQYDPILALAWLRLAAEAEHLGARECSRQLAEELSPWQIAAAEWLQDHLQGGAAQRLYPPASPEHLNSWPASGSS